MYASPKPATGDVISCQLTYCVVQNFERTHNQKGRGSFHVLAFTGSRTCHFISQEIPSGSSGGHYRFTTLTTAGITACINGRLYHLYDQNLSSIRRESGNHSPDENNRSMSARYSTGCQNGTTSRLSLVEEQEKKYKTHLFVCPSVCPSVRHSVHPSVWPFARPSVHRSVHLCICPSNRLAVCSSVYLSICLSVYLSVRPSVCSSSYPPIVVDHCNNNLLTPFWQISRRRLP